jgi:Putative peptidoglycan binding domain
MPPVSGPDLSIGASGEEVREVQARLLRSGYHIPAREAGPGFFGPATRQAVQRHQARHRLPVTGVVDAPTAAAIATTAREAGGARGIADRTPVDQERDTFARARTARLRAQADLAAKNATLAAASRTAAASDPQLQAAKDAAAAQGQAVAAARRAEEAALSGVTSSLRSWLREDPALDVARLPSWYPIVLLPVRVETRFVPEASELRVRVYPDEIFADAHEPELSAAERAAGQAYWTGGKDSLSAWQALLAAYPAPRAAWIVRVTAPGEQASPDSFSKPRGWSRAVEARLLPDRFVVIATRGTVTKRAVGAPVVEPLALTIGPDSLASDQVPVGLDPAFRLDDAVKWTIDFDTAVSAGMGIRLPLNADDLRLGFDRIIVIGVKTSMDARSTSEHLGALFEAHHYTRGLAFVKQGTPTSNTAGTPAAYPPADDNGKHSWAIERGAPLDTAPDCAAQNLTRALGLPPGLFAHVEGANLNEVTPARKMNRVLYHSTLGYFLDQIMHPLISPEAVNEVGAHFSQWVLPRGPVSAFRVGRVPYGVLPATSLQRWQDANAATPVARQMPALLQKILPFWSDAARLAPHVGRSADADQDLLDILAMDASARQIRVRRVIGNTAWLNLARMHDWPLGQWARYHQSVGAAVLSAIGVDPSTRARVAGLNLADQSLPYHGPLVDTVPSSETDPLGPRDYITWARHGTVAQLRLEQLRAGFPQEVKRVLLYRFLRHATLAEYHWWAGRLVAEFAAAPVEDFREPELVGLVPGTERRQTPWQRFQNRVSLPAIGAIDIATFLGGDFEPEQRALTGVGDYWDALDVLAPLPTAELERLFTESLDAVSHRVDAWVTSLASQRLDQMRYRRDLEPGCFVGAYGWAENLRPDTAAKVTLPGGRTARTTPGGYIQAPSMAHAITAAVLRNGYLTYLGPADSPYTIDLSSAQVRMGRFILDSVRNGQPIGAVLGYLLERAFHEQHAESLIDPVRQAAPLVANKTEDSGESADTVAARNVVDGLTLRSKWKANQLFNVPGGLPGTIAHRDILEQQLAQLDRNVDAVADLLLAESVHQAVRGSTMASGAGLDALAQGTRPPDPAVGKGTTGGTALTHRLAVVLGPAPAPSPPGWPATATPRAACEPRLDGWIGSLLGDPRNVKCQVRYTTAAGPTQTVTVTFDQLALRPTDVLALAKAVAANPAASELDRRVLHAAFGDSAPADTAAGSSFTIVYEAEPTWDRATTRTVPELLDLANAIARSAGSMRLLAPADVVLPENASRAADAQVNTPEAQSRVQAAVTALTQVQADLGNALNAVPVTTPPIPPTPAQTADLREQLRAASAFGISAAFPAFVTGTQEGGVDPMPLLAQARSVLADIASRLDAAAKASADPLDQARAIFGRDFQLVIGFGFPAGSPAAAELAQALAHGPAMLGDDPRAVHRWLTQVMRVREPLGRWRMMRILAEASGAEPATWTVAQLPHQPAASWVALPPQANEERASGKLSLVLHAPGNVLDPAQAWYGLFIDEWAETIPNLREHTGISFRYEDTRNEAAQVILVAVPPTTAQTWDFDSLTATLNETLDLAKVRAVGLELLDPIAQVIPTIFLAANAGDDTIATNLAVKHDPQIAQP